MCSQGWQPLKQRENMIGFAGSKWVVDSHMLKVKVTQSCPTLCNPIQSMEFSSPEYWSEQPFPSPWDLPKPGIEPRSPVLQVDSLPAEPPGQPRNTGVGILSLLQWILPTQELNRGLLHCRRILYQLSYQGSLSIHYCQLNFPKRQP